MARAILHGIAVSAGIGIGREYFVNRRLDNIRHRLIVREKTEDEVLRLTTAAEGVANDFENARASAPEYLLKHQDVLDTHLLLCTDPKLLGDAINRIREQRMNAEWALEETVARLADTFSKLGSSYIRDRIHDVRVVAERIIQRLTGTTATLPSGGERGVLLAHDLTPADAMGLSIKRFSALASEQGGITAHTGIIARSLRLPAVVGVSGLEDAVAPGDLVIVDGLRGKVLVAPSEIELAAYYSQQEQFSLYQKKIYKTACFPSETTDGQRVAVYANVETAAEAQGVLASGAEGIGLVRTEFGYITRSSLPTEEELYTEYAALATAMAPKKVTFRTLDVGSDKLFTERKNLEEPNPALGLRAIRYCMRHQDIFRTQLRAILRASAHGNVSVMFPLISGVEELRQAKAILDEARQELESASIPFDRDLPVGIMIELPSAVFTADMLAREADFFSIGTNDLIQYFIGVDRGNKHVAHMHQPLHPAILRAIKYVVDMAHKECIPVSVCGEMAADPHCLPILLGMPVDGLSLSPQSIPGIKHLIRRSNMLHCRDLLDQALTAPTVRIINSMVRNAMYSRFPDDISFFTSQLDAEG